MKFHNPFYEYSIMTVSLAITNYVKHCLPFRNPAQLGIFVAHSQSKGEDNNSNKCHCSFDVIIIMRFADGKMPLPLTLSPEVIHPGRERRQGRSGVGSIARASNLKMIRPKKVSELFQTMIRWARFLAR